MIKKLDIEYLFNPETRKHSPKKMATVIERDRPMVRSYMNEVFQRFTNIQVAEMAGVSPKTVVAWKRVYLPHRDALTRLVKAVEERTKDDVDLPVLIKKTTKRIAELESVCDRIEELECKAEYMADPKLISACQSDKFVFTNQLELNRTILKLAHKLNERRVGK